MNLSAMPLANESEDIVTNNGFYPDLDVAELLKNYSVSNPLGANALAVVNALALAIVSVNKDLMLYHAQNWLGVDTLADVESEKVQDDTVLILLYKHAVFTLAKSKLLVSRLTENNRDKAAASAQDHIDNSKHWVYESNEAIYQIMNNAKNISVALI